MGSLDFAFFVVFAIGMALVIIVALFTTLAVMLAVAMALCLGVPAMTVAIAFGGLASLTQQIRGAVKDALQNDYVRTLRTRGLSFNRVVFKHVLRNAAGPALSILGLQFVGMLGGIVIIEQIFAIPGMGSLSVQATSQKDIPAVMGVVATMAVIVIVVNLVIDLLSAALNPKVRLS